MISQSDVAAVRTTFVSVRGMLGKRYIPWAWTQGRYGWVRRRDVPSTRCAMRIATLLP